MYGAYANENHAQWLFSLGGQSKYITEGRNNLTAGGLQFAQLDLNYMQTDFQVWLAKGTQEDYQELNLSAVRGFQFGDWQAYLGAARLVFSQTDEYDTELATGLIYSHHPILLPSIDYVYSTQADGSFVMMALASHPWVISEQLSVFSHLSIGLDFGYASAHYDGVNHGEAGVGIQVALNPALHLQAMLGYSHPLHDVKLEQGDNHHWLSISLQQAF
ncbi:hypothetical protein PULV_a2383 [Pseudoalteromonas ulvae UL12]|nr:hypothetical protein [Pseudoalteromonas ulvae]MBE0364643.1 hypothetical protein [Pseudoalteromonas ulvae UL12]